MTIVLASGSELSVLHDPVVRWTEGGDEENVMITLCLFHRHWTATELLDLLFHYNSASNNDCFVDFGKSPNWQGKRPSS